MLGAITSELSMPAISPTGDRAKLGLKNLVDFGISGLSIQLSSRHHADVLEKTRHHPARLARLCEEFIASGQTGKQPAKCLQYTKVKTRKFWETLSDLALIPRTVQGQAGGVRKYFSPGQRQRGGEATDRRQRLWRSSSSRFVSDVIPLGGGCMSYHDLRSG